MENKVKLQKQNILRLFYPYRRVVFFGPWFIIIKVSYRFVTKLLFKAFMDTGLNIEFLSILSPDHTLKFFTK